MDWFVILQYLGLVASILIAFYSLYNVFNLRKQINLIERQTILRRSEVYPILDVKNVEIRGNNIEVALKNKGKGPAYFIGLGVKFCPLKPQETQWDFIDELIDFKDGKKMKVYPKAHIIFLRNQKKHCRLFPNESDTFRAPMSFLFSLHRKTFFGGGRWCYFDDMKTLMAQNKIRFVAVMMDIAYKDLSESIRDSEPLNSFVVDFEKHKNFEDAVKDNIPFTQRTLDWETEAEWMEKQLYETGKSSRGFLERKL